MVELEELDPPLDPPAAVAVDPGEVAIPTGLAPLLVAAEPPVTTATVVLLVNETKLAYKARKSKTGH